MREFKLADFIRGWLIGDFEPAVLKTKDFEFAVKFYKKGDKEEKHTHKVASELTVIVSGEFRMNDKIYQLGEVIWLEPNYMADFECLKAGATAVVKIPSIKGDKYICEKE